ncbi:3-ketoacyl-ACP reductase [Planococcus sp. ANT_H30]|uniref:MEDS domain-containing protein n=1 Tax=Planococcus sp. ANT_H30 TaxID=2597347 RepID=UPI0011EE4D68|nr:MEDS domain-containing protein [Planococcus sp. ANT_H30]KAA0957014.1 3-ketoacyl-ACP reductase [Planococcus sp. ANT_H30]
MGKEIVSVQDKFQLSKGDHVFYYVEELERYIDNAVSFVMDGMEQGDQILLVENERLYPKILTHLEKLLSKEQLENVHYINSFTFYWKNGNFHPPTILDYFSRIINPFLEKDLSFRTWGHIEWRDETEIISDIKEYEQAIEQLVPQLKAISVCAYDAPRLSDSLKDVLMNCHDYLMTDNNVSPISRQSN